MEEQANSLQKEVDEARLTSNSSAAENEERHIAEVRQEYETRINAINEKISAIQQSLNQEEVKSKKLEEEIEVEEKLNREKEERLTQRVDSLNHGLKEANDRAQAVQLEKEEKEKEIQELNSRVESALAVSRDIQSQQLEKEKVITKK